MRTTDNTGRRAVAGAALMLALTGGLAACQTSRPTETKIVVPSAATSTPEYEGDGSVPDQRYVIRMSDGERDWEVEFPEVATGYEMHIPLDERRARSGLDEMRWESQNLTAADRELLRHLRRENKQIERQGVYKGGKNVTDPQKKKKGAQRSRNRKGSEKPSLEKLEEEGPDASGSSGKSKKPRESEEAPYRPSYLMGLQEVRRLYKSGNYELAMVRLKKLEEAYPDDEKILSMKGTLWLKLDRPKLARKAWERVLQINPDNEKVIEALKRLK